MFKINDKAKRLEERRIQSPKMSSELSCISILQDQSTFLPWAHVLTCQIPDSMMSTFNTNSSDAHFCLTKGVLRFINRIIDAKVRYK